MFAAKIVYKFDGQELFWSEDSQVPAKGSELYAELPQHGTVRLFVVDRVRHQVRPVNAASNMPAALVSSAPGGFQVEAGEVIVYLSVKDEV